MGPHKNYLKSDKLLVGKPMDITDKIINQVDLAPFPNIISLVRKERISLRNLLQDGRGMEEWVLCVNREGF